MTELRLHRDLYRATAVDEAVASLASYATFERADEATHFVVRISATTPVRERRIAGEVSNFALGLTVNARGNERGKRR
jgi:hypothetical protein